jgi:aldose sugar dehydrogenase
MKSFLILIVLFSISSSFVAMGSIPFKVEVITKKLHYPWGMVFLDDQTVLVTEKTGKLKQVVLSSGKQTTITGAPKALVFGQGGLLDIIKHPLFDRNRFLYFSYSKRIKKINTTAVARGRLDNGEIKDLTDILITNAFSKSGHHFGSRLAFDNKGLLYVTVGERGDRNRAQSLESHAGKVLRIHDDGSVPKDNPFINQSNAEPEIYTWGHRNPQGMVYDPKTDRLWIHEHGPKGGDEINLLKAGVNYGWPVITYGREYSGFKITDQTHHPDMAQPIWQWTPSIAPSGMLIITGDKFKQWKGDLFVGALKFRLLSHLSMAQSKVTLEKRYLTHLNERIRAVKMGPTGNIFLLTDGTRGQLIKLSPATK